MHHRRAATLVATLLACAALALTVGDASGRQAAAPNPAAVAAPGFVEVAGRREFTGRLMVRPVQDADWAAKGLAAAARADRRSQAVARLAPRLVRHAPGPDRFIVSVPPGRTESSYARELMATGLYEHAEPDWLVYPAQFVPDDPDFPSQWEHAKIESAKAWLLAPDDPAIVCAFVDSGVDTDHPDLEPLLVPGFNAVNNLPQASGGSVQDINGHGTQVAGCVGALANNGLGSAGMAFNLKLMPVKASNLASGAAALSVVLDGAEWAADHGARVVSASYTGVASPTVQSSGAYIRSKGAVFLFAADNSGTNHSSFDHPDVIVIGSTDINDLKSGFSSYGIALDAFAPGSGIRTTKMGGTWTNVSGTSYATPLVNGLVGLIISADPSLTPAETEAILLGTCDDIGEPGEDDVFGWGRVNAFGAVFAAVAPGAGPTAPYAVDDAAATIESFPITIDALANDFDLNSEALAIAAFDGASALGGTVLHLGGGEFSYTPPLATSGLDSFTYTITDASAMSSAPATVTIDITDLDAFRDPDTVENPAPGVAAAYYLLSSPTTMPDFDALAPFGTETVPDINYPATEGVFAGSGLADNVGAVFTGFFEAPAIGVYTFHTSSSDGSRLFIGDDLVVENNGIHPMVERPGEALLKPGMHAVTVEFFEATGVTGLVVSVEGPGLAKAPIPASMWSIDLGAPPCPADLSGDGAINSTDLNILLGSFGTSNAAGDISGDGFVDSTDLNLLLAAFGDPC